MRFSEFIGQVQHRLELPGEGEALRVTRAVLTTLGERIQAGEAEDLAAPLPMEVDRFLTSAASGERFGYDEFTDRVADRAGTDRSEAAYYSKTVVALVAEVVPSGEIAQVRDQLPTEFDALFELVDSSASAG